MPQNGDGSKELGKKTNNFSGKKGRKITNEITAIVFYNNDEVIKVYTEQDDVERGLEMKINDTVLCDNMGIDTYIITNIQDSKNVRMIALERG